MGRICCVPNCYTGYRNTKNREKEKGALYGVPRDNFFKEQWNKAIARADRPIDLKDAVCYKHFKADDFVKERFLKTAMETYKRVPLKADAVPSIFPETPDFILKITKKRGQSYCIVKDQKDVKLKDEKNLKQNVKDTELNALHKEEKTDVKNNYEDKKDYKNIEKEFSNSRPQLEKLENAELHIKSEIYEEIDPGPKVYKCDKCSYTSTFRHNVLNHGVKHEQEYKYFCEHCPKFKTKWADTYKNHMRIKHDVGPQKFYQCTICSFSSKIQISWKRHIERHNKLLGISRYQCCDCDFQCDRFSTFKVHVAKHKNNQKNEKSSQNVPNNEQNNKNISPNTSKNTVNSIVKNLVSNEKTQGLNQRKVLKCANCQFTSKSILCLKLHMKKHT